MIRSMLTHLHQALIEPPLVYEVDVRNKSRLLSIFLLAMIFIFAGVDITYVLTLPNYAVPWYGYVFLLTAFTLNRLPYYQISAWLTAFMFPVVIFSSVLRGEANDPAVSLGFLTAGLILAGILLSYWGVLIYAVVNSIGILLLPRLVPQWFPEASVIISPLAILLISSALVTVSMRHRDRVELERQALLRQSEERYRMLFDEAPEGIMIISPENRILMANEAIYQMTGYTPEEVIGRTPTEFVAQDDMFKRPPRPIEQIQVPGRLKRERVILCKDGSRLHVFIASSYMPDGYLQYIIQDISERRKMEDALRASEEKFAKSFQSSPDAVTLSSITTGKFIDMNDGFCHMSGYTREEALGRSAEELHIWVDIENRQRMVTILQQHGRVRDFETMLRTRAGEVINAMLSVERIEVSGEPCMVVITRDVTKQKRIEAEREKLITELESKNAELEQFTYMVSHDLKAPIITIKGFLGFLAEDAKSGNVQRLEKDVRRISEATDKMHNLLNDLLELSRIGRLMNDPEPVDCNQVCFEVEKILHGQLQEHNIQVRVPEPLPVVMGDRQRLFEVFQNLLDNASKFMGNQSNPRIEIGQQIELQNGFATLYIRDNGIGIAPQFHERIFGLFNRLDPKVEGTGIGLALVRRIVEFHGGKMWVESEVGQGATFFFSLPLATK